MRCADYLAARLSGEVGPDLDAHGAACADCAGRQVDHSVVAAVLADATTWAEPPIGLEEEVMASVTGVAPADLAVTPSAEMAAAPILRVAEAPPSRTWRWLGWAAVIALVVGVAIPVIRSNEPDWEVTLVGAGPAPDATATVAGWATDAGTRMRIDAAELPPAPEGWVYELWLSRGDIHMSAGSFRYAEDVDLWAGVSRGDFPRVWVTLEPVDTDPSVNGETVLDQA